MSEIIKIYCDGACKGNPGMAGSGLSIYNGSSLPTLPYGEYNERGTNNTAELNALYKALLLASKEQNVIIYSDSKYSIDCITKWAYNWKKKGWTKQGGEIKNLEIIKLAHNLYEDIKENIRVEYVKAHTGIEGNELADRMAMVAISSRSVEYREYQYNLIDSVLKI